MSLDRDYIRPQISTITLHPDGTKTTTRDPAVWTLAHRGYSGSGRLDIWVYPTKRSALQAGADLAMASGLEEDPEARRLFATGRFQAVLDRYEAAHAETFLLRVQTAFLQPG